MPEPWSGQTAPFNVGPLSSVTCTSVTSCLATVGSTGNASDAIIGTKDGGATWSVQNVPVTASDLFSGITCSTALDCYAVGTGINTGVIVASADGGSTWTSQSVPTGSAVQLSAVSCSAATVCMAVGAGGNSSGVILAYADPTVSTPSVPVGAEGTPYSFALQAAGSTDPYTWSPVRGPCPMVSRCRRQV